MFADCIIATRNVNAKLSADQDIHILPCVAYQYYIYLFTY